MKRRKFLLVTTLGVAGCAGDGDDGGENGGDNAGEDGDDSGGDATENDGTGDEPTLAENFQWEESFIADVDITSAGERTTSATIRFNSGNVHQTVETEEGTVELYEVDGDTYIIQQGQCFKNPGQDMAASPPVAPQDQDDLDEEFGGLSPAGRDTINGEDVWVYEAEADEAIVTWYVSTETEYIVRVEFQEATVDYHSWGEVDPIEPPDMECQEFGEPGGDG